MNHSEKNGGEGSGRFVSASEIHKFFYCPYSWWFEKGSPAPEQLGRLREGENFHRRQDERLGAARKLEESSNWLLLIGAGLLLAALTYFLLAGAQ